MKAVEIIGREDGNQIPVMSDGRVEGIVSRAYVLHVLRSRAGTTGATKPATSRKRMRP
jgi:hypothetical protein